MTNPDKKRRLFYSDQNHPDRSEPMSERTVIRILYYNGFWRADKVEQRSIVAKITYFPNL